MASAALRGPCAAAAVSRSRLAFGPRLLVRRGLGDTTSGPQIGDMKANWKIAKSFFTKDAVSYAEYKQQCVSLRLFAFAGVTGGCVVALVLNPPQSSYWQRYGPTFWWSHVKSCFSSTQKPLFLTAPLGNDTDVPAIVRAHVLNSLGASAPSKEAPAAEAQESPPEAADPGKKNKRIIALFDVDGTLTEPRKVVSPETLEYLKKLRQIITVGVVGGSDLVKQKEQLGDSPNMFDYCFSENGLLAYKDGQKIGETSLVGHLGEENLKRVINWTLRYVADLDIPIKRGTFIEFRNGMLNFSPIGRNCSRDERNEFEKFDLEHKIRETMVAKFKEEFPELNLTMSIGGQISFDVFPQGWDKTYCLNYLPKEDFDEIHFFGDKTFPGGNDFELFSSDRTEGHTITKADPLETLQQLEKLFGVPAPAKLSPPGSH